MTYLNCTICIASVSEGENDATKSSGDKWSGRVLEAGKDLDRSSESYDAAKGSGEKSGTNEATRVLCPVRNTMITGSTGPELQNVLKTA